MKATQDVATGTLEIVAGGLRHQFEVAIAPATGPVDHEATLGTLRDALFAGEACAMAVTVQRATMSLIPEGTVIFAQRAEPLVALDKDAFGRAMDVYVKNLAKAEAGDPEAFRSIVGAADQLISAAREAGAL